MEANARRGLRAGDECGTAPIADRARR